MNNSKNYDLVYSNLPLKWEANVALLRIFACVFIVIFHTGRNDYLGNLDQISPINYLTRHGDIGVDIFFLITGYLVIKHYKPQDPLNFLISRAIRLFPLMLLVITSMYILSRLHFANVSEILFLDYVRAATLTFQLNPLDTFLPPLWTLVYQVKFWAAFSLVLLIQLRFNKNNSIVFGSILLYSYLQFYFYHYSFMQNWGLGFYGNFLAAGVLLSILKFSNTKRDKIFSILLLIVTWLNFLTSTKYEPISISIIIFSCIILLFPLDFLFSKKSVLLLRKLDYITYPLYLIHFPFMLFLLRKLRVLESYQEIIYLLVFVSTILICYCLNKYFNDPVSKHLTKSLNRFNKSLRN